MKFIINSSAIVMFIDNKTVKIEKTQPVYSKIVEIIGRLPVSEQEGAISEILKKSNPNADMESKGFVVSGDQVSLDGEELPTPLAAKIASMIRENLPVELFKPFWANLKENPAYHVVKEKGFFDFLSYRELPMTEDGCFLAYRGIQNNWWSVSGNPQTKVLNGKVNGRGQIYNGIGEVIEVERNGVSDDRNVHCHNASLHCGSLDYAQRWGQKVVVVKVNPKDVVCAPNDCEAQKLRVCKFEVVAELEAEIVAPVVDEKNQPILDNRFKKSSVQRSEMIHRVSSYLGKKRNQGYEYVTVKAVQGIFSPNCPSRVEVLDALQTLGFAWDDGLSEGIIFL